MKKGEVTAKILEIIVEAPRVAVDIVEAILTAGYGASYGKISKQLSIQEKNRTKREIKFREEQRLYNLISQLKKDGLIKENFKTKKKTFITTVVGKKKLLQLKQKLKNQLPEKVYPKEKGETLIIIIFDIPEKHKAKRNWLRDVLKGLNFHIIQKSVWIGKTKIPIEFIKDLKMLNLIDFVEIFEVSKIGSLKDKFKSPSDND